MDSKYLYGTIGVCLFFSSLSSHAALIGRDLDGNNTTAEAYYVTGLDITVYADASPRGRDTWDNQMAWVSTLELHGVDGWRLPSADTNNDGTVIDCTDAGVTDCGDNELQYLYWEEGITPDTPGPFIGVESLWGYWFNTELTSTAAWWFNPQNGGISATPKTSSRYAWPVQDGMVGNAVIPVPAAVWLFASGLIGLIGIARRKRI